MASCRPNPIRQQHWVHQTLTTPHHRHRTQTQTHSIMPATYLRIMLTMPESEASDQGPADSHQRLEHVAQPRSPYAGRHMVIAQHSTSGCSRDIDWGRGSGKVSIKDTNRWKLRCSTAEKGTPRMKQAPQCSDRPIPAVCKRYQ